MAITGRYMDLCGITVNLARLKSRIKNRSEAMAEWQGRTLEYVAPGSYGDPGPWEPVRVGRTWQTGQSLQLRQEIRVPDDFAPDSTFLEIRFDLGEALVSINGRTCGAIDSQHHFIPVAPALREEGVLAVDMTVWLNANQITQIGRTGDAAFRTAELVEVNGGIWRYYLHMKMVTDYIELLPDAESELKHALQAAAHRSMYMIDPTGDIEDLRCAVVRADERLAEDMGALDFRMGGRLELVGHTHLDTAWLWPFRETVRKCGRTFANVLALMDQYPEFTFACSQPQLLKFTKQHYPETYERIKQRVQEGRWEPVGVLWVESDVNIPSGESLVRQILYGHQFYMQEFGKYTPIAWLPDVFGYSPSLPQILKKAGIEYFLTCKVFWCYENLFPHRLFWWEGIDGSRVLAHTPWLGHTNMYNARPGPELYRFAWEQFSQKENYDRILVPYGWGDGGGGPTPKQVEHCRWLQKLPGLPQSESSTVARYFERAERQAKELPTWFGEIYVESHQGTLTTQSWLKKANRQAEQLYRRAEVFSSLCRILGKALDVDSLREGWELILLNQFHDVLPGSSIAEVYVESRDHYERIRQLGEDLLDASLERLTAHHGLADGPPGVCVFNPTAWQRSGVIDVDGSGWGKCAGLRTLENERIPVQFVADSDSEGRFVCEVTDLPSWGYRYYQPMDAGIDPPANELTVRADCVANRFVRIDLTPQGLIRQITSKVSGRGFVEEGGQANLFQLFRDGPAASEAWDLDPGFEESVEDLVALSEVEVLESGPLRGRLRITRDFHDSQIVQDIVVYRTSPVIDFQTRVNWQERHRMLKVCFPTTLRAQQATYEVAYGCYERETHRNAPLAKMKFEVAMHRFVDLSEGDRGLALLNDCKYACDVLAGRIRLTLLRGPMYPDPEADRGEHTFTYSLYAHEGDWGSAQVVQRAAELNSPLLVRPVGATGGQGAEAPVFRTGLLSVAPANVILEVLKTAESEDAIVLRAYESCGNLSPATLTLGFEPKRIVECDLLERPGKDVAMHGCDIETEFQPFEIKSFLIYL